MYSSINKKKQVDFNSKPKKARGSYSSIGNFVPNLKEINNLPGVQASEKIHGNHFEMKIAGYIKDDFNHYIINNKLVVTTERIGNPNQITGTKVSKHAYCYPSALFKKTFHLPDDIEKDRIIVDYKDQILSVDLLKSKTISNS